MNEYEELGDEVEGEDEDVGADNTRIIIEANDFRLACPQCEALVPELIINRRWAFDFDCEACGQPLTLNVSLDC